MPSSRFFELRARAGAGRSPAAVRWACGGPHLTCICMHRRKAARERERGKEGKSNEQLGSGTKRGWSFAILLR